MLVNFSVENYGPIRDKQTLSFEAQKSAHLEDEYVINANGLRLLKFAIIFGANASGKSTIIEALRFLYNLILYPNEKKSDELNFTPFLFDETSKKKNTILSIDFLQNDARYYYSVEFNWTHIVSEELFLIGKNERKTNVFKRSTDSQKQVSKIKFGREFKISKAAIEILELHTLWNTTVLSSFTKVNLEQKELKDSTDWINNHLFWTNTPDDDFSDMVTDFIDSDFIKKEKVLEIIQKADFNINDILYKELKTTESGGAPKEYDIRTSHKVKNTSYSLPFVMESDGTRRFYSLAGLLEMARTESNLLAIDEIDASLHPDLVIHYLLMFMENVKQSQLIITTHNREILDDKNLFRNDAIWFTNKNEDGAAELYSLDDFDSAVIRNTSNILNAYKSGKLKAVPKTKDFYL